MEYSVCLLAAGQGSRTNLHFNKVHYILGDLKDPNCRTILDRSLQVFLDDEDCKQILLACAEKEQEFVKELYREHDRIEVLRGGSTRQESVAKALEKVRYPYVFIHDAARPYLKCEQIEELKKTLETDKACLLMVPSTDTIKIVRDGYVKTTLDRSLTFNAQTPQCFETDLIKACHKKAKEEGRVGTDDTQLIEWYSDVPVKVVVGDSSNIKVTLPKDLQ